jgi:hypothetical protein
MAFELGDLKARLLVDSKGFSDTLARAGEGARTSFRSIGTSIAGAFTFGAIASRVQEAMALADRLQDTAVAAGTTVTRFQALERAAQDAGASGEKLQMAMSRIDIARALAGSGSDEGQKMAEAMERLGVSALMLAGSDPALIIEQIGRSLDASNDSAAAMNDVFSIFGSKIGPTFIQSLREIGAEGLDPLIARMEASGRIMSESMVDDLARANKSIEQLNQRVTVFAGNFGEGLMRLGEMAGYMWEGYSRAEAYALVMTEAADAVQELTEAEKERAKVEQAIGANYDRAGAVGDKMEAARLTKAEKLKQITEQIAALNDQMYGADAMKRSQLYNQAKELEAQADPLRRELGAEADKRATAADRDFDKRLQSAATWGRDMERRLMDIQAGRGVTVAAPQAADQLAKVGGFVGGQTDPMISIAQRQLQIQQQMREFLAQAAVQLQTIASAQLGGMAE